MCYKPHKASHENDTPSVESTSVVTGTAALVEGKAIAATTLPPRTRPGNKKLDFSSLQNDPDLLRLMSRYPGLRIQLQHIYSFTLEPDPQEQRGGFSDRGRGRGRGRGGRGSWRGQRGGFASQQRPSQWNQAKGDKEAYEAFKRMREKEGDEEGLGEFVRLIAMKFGAEAEETEEASAAGGA